MTDKSLKAFWNDKETKENVYNYLVQYLEKVALEKVFNKQDAIAVGEAMEIITKAFENLDYLFSSKVKEKEQINEAR